MKDPVAKLLKSMAQRNPLISSTTTKHLPASRAFNASRWP